MPPVNYGSAQAQAVLMLQKVSKIIEVSQNLDSTLAKMFSFRGDDIGLQSYRQGLQIEVGGIVGAYQPDGGNYFQGSGPDYTQFIPAPIPIMDSISTTELSRRISKGGTDIVVDDYLARLIRDVKVKVSHKMNAYLQTYNDGKLASVDASWGGVSTTIPLKSGEFGGRLIDLNDVLQVADSSANMLGQVSILEINKNSIGGIDTVVIDSVPIGMSTSSSFYPIGVASGNPVFIAGLKYLVTPSTSGDYFGLSRGLPYVQSPALNANGVFVTLAGSMAFLQRVEQALGSERYQAERQKNFFYMHGANYVSTQFLGFGKQIVLTQDGKAPNYDGVPDTFSASTLAGVKVVRDSTAAVDKIYFLDKSVLNCVKYPGSQAFIPGMIEGGLFWPRQVGGNWNSQSDAFYQDSRNFYSRNLWANAVYYGLGTQPVFAS